MKGGEERLKRGGWKVGGWRNAGDIVSVGWREGGSSEFVCVCVCDFAHGKMIDVA